MLTVLTQERVEGGKRGGETSLKRKKKPREKKRDFQLRIEQEKF